MEIVNGMNVLKYCNR